MKNLRGDVPKECLDVCGIPMIGHALLEMALSGLEEVAVVVSPDKPELASLLADMPPFPERALVDRLYPGPHAEYARHAWPRLVITEQREPRGVVDALATARGYISGEPFVLVMPDNLLVGAAPVTATLARDFARSGEPTIAYMPIGREEAVTLGNCGRLDLAGDGMRVAALHPKRPGVFDVPEGVTQINRAVGRTIVPPELADPDDPIWDAQPGARELDDAPRFAQLAREGRLRAVATGAALYDLGQPGGVRAAREAFG